MRQGQIGGGGRWTRDAHTHSDCHGDLEWLSWWSSVFVDRSIYVCIYGLLSSLNLRLHITDCCYVAQTNWLTMIRFAIEQFLKVPTVTSFRLIILANVSFECKHFGSYALKKVAAWLHFCPKFNVHTLTKLASLRVINPNEVTCPCPQAHGIVTGISHWSLLKRCPCFRVYVPYLQYSTLSTEKVEKRLPFLPGSC